MSLPKSTLTSSEVDMNFEYSGAVSFLMQHKASKRNFDSTTICTYETFTNFEQSSMRWTIRGEITTERL